MLWIFVVGMLAVWLLGVTTKFTMGGLIHMFLVVAVVSVFLRILRGSSTN